MEHSLEPVSRHQFRYRIFCTKEYQRGILQLQFATIHLGQMRTQQNLLIRHLQPSMRGLNSSQNITAVLERFLIQLFHCQSLHNALLKQMGILSLEDR